VAVLVSLSPRADFSAAMTRWPLTPCTVL